MFASVLKTVTKSESSASDRLASSSELFAGLLAAFIVAANAALDLGFPAAAVAAAVVALGSYVGSRTLAKSAGKKIRAGVRTAEFWVAIVTALAPVVAAHFGYNITAEQVALFVGPLAALIIGRGAVKKAEGSVDVTGPATTLVLDKVSAEKLTQWLGGKRD